MSGKKKNVYWGSHQYQDIKYWGLIQRNAMLSAIIFKTQAKEEGKRRQEKRRMGGWGGHSEHSTGTKEVKKRNGFLQNKQANPFPCKTRRVTGLAEASLVVSGRPLVSLFPSLYKRSTGAHRRTHTCTHARAHTHSCTHTYTRHFLDNVQNSINGTNIVYYYKPIYL